MMGAGIAYGVGSCMFFSAHAAVTALRGRDGAANYASAGAFAGALVGGAYGEWRAGRCGAHPRREAGATAPQANPLSLSLARPQAAEAFAQLPRVDSTLRRWGWACTRPRSARDGFGSTAKRPRSRRRRRIPRGPGAGAAASPCRPGSPCRGQTTRATATSRHPTSRLRSPLLPSKFRCIRCVFGIVARCGARLGQSSGMRGVTSLRRLVCSAIGPSAPPRARPPPNRCGLSSRATATKWLREEEAHTAFGEDELAVQAARHGHHEAVRPSASPLRAPVPARSPARPRL